MRPDLEHGSVEQQASDGSGASFPPSRPAPDAGDRRVRAPSQGPTSDEDDAPPEPRPLTPAEAQALSLRLGSASPWKVLKLQGVVGGTVAALAGAWSGGEAFWSALWGAAVIVLPGVVMARAMARQPPAGASAATGAVSFLLWEFVKIALSVALLLLAVKVVQPLNWLALLAGLVGCAKVYWVLLFQDWRRPRGM